MPTKNNPPRLEQKQEKFLRDAARMMVMRKLTDSEMTAVSGRIDFDNVKPLSDRAVDVVLWAVRTAAQEEAAGKYQGWANTDIEMKFERVSESGGWIEFTIRKKNGKRGRAI